MLTPPWTLTPLWMLTAASYSSTGCMQSHGAGATRAVAQALICSHQGAHTQAPQHWLTPAPHSPSHEEERSPPPTPLQGSHSVPPYHTYTHTQTPSLETPWISQKVNQPEQAQLSCRSPGRGASRSTTAKELLPSLRKTTLMSSPTLLQCGVLGPRSLWKLCWHFAPLQAVLKVSHVQGWESSRTHLRTHFGKTGTSYVSRRQKVVDGREERGAPSPPSHWGF